MNCYPLHVCKISGQSVTRATENFFSEISLAPVEAFSNGMPWKDYKQMVINSSTSLTSQVTVTFNAKKHL